MGTTSSKNRYLETEFSSFFQGSLSSGGALIALDAQTQLVIGSSRFHRFNAQASEIEIGWTFLVRSHWGGKYNGELKRMMLQHAFQYVEHVVLLVGPNNYRSQGAVKKIGGIAIGSRTDSSGTKSTVFQISASSFSEAGKKSNC